MIVFCITMGCLQACLIAFFYRIYYILRQQTPQPVRPLPPATFDAHQGLPRD